MPKYKISEIAKDFEVETKEVIEALDKVLPKKRTSSSTLTEAETNVIFEIMTQKTAQKNFDSFVSHAKRVMKEKQNAKSEKKAQPKTEAKAQPKKEETKKTEAKPTQKKADAPAKDKKQADRKPNNEPKKNDAQKKAPAKDTKKPEAKKEQSAQPKKDDGKLVQSRTKGEKRRVDTRSSNVDLEKYNEHYEEIAPTDKRADRSSNKQKIKQKSQQYRRQGMRSSKRETEKERLDRIAAERAKKTIVIKVPEEISVGDLAALLHMTSGEVIKKLMLLGVMANVNQVIDFETAEIVATELGAKVEKEVVVTIEERIIDDSEDKEEDLVTRDPVVVVMGHVDHGKTSILDAIRNTAVTSTEAGGITQHIGAYRVSIDDKLITFLDTPGHAAFTSMRARGAMATDIAVLVVAADDGIMPQTVEAISHAKAAGVQIIVAINKMDKEGANPERIKQQLTEYSLVPEEWGGDTICVPVSAKTQMGIDDLLENILLVAEMSDLKANPNRAAKGVVIEARLDKGRGPIATLLVQNGTLHSGDIIVAGSTVGRVRVMVNEKGRKLKEAGPSVPVEIMGLAETPNAGDQFDSVADEKLARELVEQRKQKAKEEQFNAMHKVTFENLFDSIKDGEMKELNIIVKADVQGSVEAVTQNLEKLSNDEVRVRVILGGVGAINDSDVMLANASNAIIVGFNVRPDPNATVSAERDGVQMRMYRVIYDCIEEVQAAMKGMLAPKFREVQLGRIEVRSVFNISNVGKIAGSYVLEGKVTRSAQIRVVRDGIVIAEDEIASLRRMKDDVKEVATNYECGIGLQKFGDIKEGDILEAFVMEEYRD